jgi:hypothetical protein
MILQTNNLQKSTSAGSVGLPKLETVSAPLVQLYCTSQVHLWIAWRLSFAALSPINVVDLPNSHISRSIRVVVDCMCVSSTFMGDDAFAAVGIPIVFSAPSADILHGFGGSAGTAGTFA